MNLTKLTKVLFPTLALTFNTMSAYAVDWVVDSQQSQLNFISTKKISIAEIHEFKHLQGNYDSEGKFELDIDLSSVDTHNEVRDGRMKEFLFDVSTFTTAKITAQIAPEDIDAIAQGASQRFTIDAMLDLHGVTKPLSLDVIVTRLVGAKLSVVSVKPVIISADDYALESGINKLMELAALPSISHAVPVSFYLTLKLK